MPSLFPISKYRLVHKKLLKSEENVINLRSEPHAFRYSAYAAKLLFEDKHSEVFLHATGQATNKVVQVVEILRNRIHGLHVNYEIKSTEFADEYHPKEEGLNIVTVQRYIHSVHAVLTIKEGKKYEKCVGYMAPVEKVFDEEGFKKKVAAHFEKGQAIAEKKKKRREEYLENLNAKKQKQSEKGEYQRKNETEFKEGEAKNEGNSAQPNANQSKREEKKEVERPVYHRPNYNSRSKREPRNREDEYNNNYQKPQAQRVDRGYNFSRGEQNRFRGNQGRNENNYQTQRRDDFRREPVYNQNNRRYDDQRGTYSSRHEGNDRRFDNYKGPVERERFNQSTRGQPQNSNRNVEGRPYRNYENPTHFRSDSRGRSWKNQREEYSKEDSQKPVSGNFRSPKEQSLKQKTGEKNEVSARPKFQERR